MMTKAAFLMLLISISALAGCSGQDDGAIGWTEVIAWEGSSNNETETFAITSDEWRIRWETEPGETFALFQIYVYTPSRELQSLAVDTMEPGKDISYLQGSGEYYFEINTAQAYKVVVEQKQ